MPPRKNSTPLQRGLACLSCRKRKLKCDATRPVCRQCTKMNRAGECEYDDKRQKSRTQKLKEKLMALEERIRELESGPAPETGSNEIFALFNTPSPPGSSGSPHAFAGASFDGIEVPSAAEMHGQTFGSMEQPPWARSSSSASSSSSSVSVSYNRDSFSGPSTSQLEFDEFDPHPSAGNGPFEMSPFTDIPSASYPYLPHWDPKDPLPFENKRILMDIFMQHRHQCWFDGNLSRFDLTTTQPPGTEPHPALMNAIFLLGCSFARTPQSALIEPVFLTKALHEITVSLDNSDRLVDIVRASCLLSIYFYANCRMLEGYCHSFSAARLAVGLGLHQIRPPTGPNGSVSVAGNNAFGFDAPTTSTSIPLAPPKDQMELRDRISTFWQVFMVDRCWSVANGLPVALPDTRCRQSQIKTPWPQPYTDPIHGNPEDIDTINYFFQHPTTPDLQSIPCLPALRAKATAFFERTYRLQSTSNKNDKYWMDYNAVKSSLEHFQNSLPWLGYEGWRTQAPYIDVELFTILTLVHVSFIHLQQDLIQMEIYQNANSVLALIRQLTDADYEYLDPILSSCWMTVAKLFIRVLGAAVNSVTAIGTDPYAVNIIEPELQLIINAMKTLSAFFPVAGDHAKKIEQQKTQALASAGAL